MWPKLSAEAIGMHALQYGGDAALVSVDEFDDAADGGDLQRHGGVFAAAALADGRNARFFQGWIWFDHKAAVYGWVPIAAGLLAWDYLVWKEARPKVRGWFTRKLLTLSLAAGIAPILPWWIPAGAPPGQFLSMISKYPGLPVLLAWGVVLVVLVLLCVDAESRDYLLGHGKVLSVVSMGLLLLVLTMTMVGWAVTS